MPIAWIHALMGGVLIGAAATLFLFWNGRVAGISGIIGQSFSKAAQRWQLTFLLGLLLGGVLLQLINPVILSSSLSTPAWALAVAGLLVGFGTQMGSGCTSGHGVCGISRFSLRSILATVIFIAFGMGCVALVRTLGGLT